MQHHGQRLRQRVPRVFARLLQRGVQQHALLAVRARALLTVNMSLSADNCARCPANTYSGSGEAECNPCALHATSLEASGDPGDCLCNASCFGSASTPNCFACAPGTYKTSKGSANCNLCLDGAQRHAHGHVRSVPGGHLRGQRQRGVRALP